MDVAALLIIAILLPFIGAVLMWQMAPLGRNYVRYAALAVTLVTLFVAGLIVFPREPAEIGPTGEFAVSEIPWIGGANAPSLDITFSVGLDGLSVWLFGLSALLMVTAVLVSWDAIDDRAALFYAMLLLLECGCLGVFAARDIILFYVFFEFTLIPLFFLIGIWGSEDRRYAAMKFFVFTLAGSVLTFLGLLAIVLWHAHNLNGGTLSFSIPELTSDLQAAIATGDGMSARFQMWIFLALFIGFAIKVPLFPLHTWLPLAHVQAPTAGSVILAGILLKIGTYGFVRFSIPMLPDAAAIAMPALLWLAVIGIIYGALVALAQTDMKRLIAYSSVSHLGFVMLGLFAFNRLGVQGGTLQMINHGISTGALFALVGMLYERFHTRDIKDLGGLARQTPWLAFFMLVFTLSSIGLPGLNGFAGEFLVLIGMFQRAWAEAPSLWSGQLLAIAVLAVLGVVLGAWYMLWLIQRVFFGPEKSPVADETHAVRDMNWREVISLAPLAVFVVWIGIRPGYFLDRMETTLNRVSEIAQTAVERNYPVEESVADQRDGSEVEKLTRAR